jgi:tRNA threonylcarbamoyladenosine biosynthesis protein TsaE
MNTIIKVTSLEELPQVASRLVSILKQHSGVVALYGEMGAGKTTLVNALMREMASEDDVTSPTFALINEYLTGEGESVYHFDFYRIDDPREAFDMGYEEYFYSGRLCLVEWPEKIEELIPDDALRLTITVASDYSRTITLSNSKGE